MTFSGSVPEVSAGAGAACSSVLGVSPEVVPHAENSMTATRTQASSEKSLVFFIGSVPPKKMLISRLFSLKIEFSVRALRGSLLRGLHRL